jgi:hypothetical protein
VILRSNGSLGSRQPPPPQRSKGKRCRGGGGGGRRIIIIRRHCNDVIATWDLGLVTLAINHSDLLFLCFPFLDTLTFTFVLAEVGSEDVQWINLAQDEDQ